MRLVQTASRMFHSFMGSDLFVKGVNMALLCKERKIYTHQVKLHSRIRVYILMDVGFSIKKQPLTR